VHEYIITTATIGNKNIKTSSTTRKPQPKFETSLKMILDQEFRDHQVRKVREHEKLLSHGPHKKLPSTQSNIIKNVVDVDKPLVRSIVGRASHAFIASFVAISFTHYKNACMVEHVKP
jgi:hypothetical protein